MEKDAPSTGVFIVDDHPSIIAGLSALMASEPDLTLIGSARTADSAATHFADPRASVAILDITLEQDQGLSWIARLMSRFPTVKVLLHSMHTDQETLRNALQMQVGGFILKSSDPRLIVPAIRSVRAGGTYVDPVLLSRTLGRSSANQGIRIAPHPAHPKVSTRELDTLRLTALGYGIKEIAAEFNLSPKSVETYKLRAAEKLGLGTRSAIVRYAIANGWFSALD